VSVIEHLNFLGGDNCYSSIKGEKKRGTEKSLSHRVREKRKKPLTKRASPVGKKSPCLGSNERKPEKRIFLFRQGKKI